MIVSLKGAIRIRKLLRDDLENSFMARGEQDLKVLDAWDKVNTVTSSIETISIVIEEDLTVNIPDELIDTISAVAKGKI